LKEFIVAEEVRKPIDSLYDRCMQLVSDWRTTGTYSWAIFFSSVWMSAAQWQTKLACITNMAVSQLLTKILLRQCRAKLNTSIKRTHHAGSSLCTHSEKPHIASTFPHKTWTPRHLRKKCTTLEEIFLHLNEGCLQTTSLILSVWTLVREKETGLQQSHTVDIFMILHLGQCPSWRQRREMCCSL
jgi:hypothetical protein